MKKLYSFLLIAWIFSSCSDKTQINLISGRLFEACETPLPSREIAFKTTIGGDPTIIGSAISDPNGFYNFTYELEEERTGSGEIILINPDGFQLLVEDVTLNEDFNLDLYQKDTIQILIILEGSKIFSSSDTLFFGYNRTGEEYMAIEPMNSELQTIESTLLTSFENAAPLRIYYGIGEVEFAQAKAQTANETAIRNIDLKVSPCNLIDTARIVID